MQPQRIEPPNVVPWSDTAVVRVSRALVTSADVASKAGVRGHLGMGVVEESGNSAWLGMRVVWQPASACARCERCRSGLAAHCDTRRIMGFADRAGCLAARVTIPIRDLIAVPGGVDDDAAACSGLIAAAAEACRAARADSRGFLTVLGDGPIGLLAAQILAGRNSAVRLLGRHESRFSLAERWGIKHRHESEAGRRRDQDVVLDCTGSPAGVALASRLVRPRGTIVVKGPPHTEALGTEGLWPADLAPVLSGEITLRTATTLNTRDGLDMIASGKVDPLPLLTRRVPMARLGDALKSPTPGGPPLTIVEV